MTTAVCCCSHDDRCVAVLQDGMGSGGRSSHQTGNQNKGLGNKNAYGGGGAYWGNN